MTVNTGRDSASPAFLHASQTEVEQIEPGIRRQILGFGPDLMVCRIWFETGAVGQVHSHRHSQSSFVESGRFRVVIDGDTRDLAPGDAYYVAPHLEHGSTCLEEGVLIDTFSPMRADFLRHEC